MKKILITFFVCLFTCFAFTGIVSAESNRNYKSIYTIDAKTGYVIDGYEIDKKLPIASMAKIMTALLGFEGVKNGKIALGQKVVISDEASGMGGSQMFLESGDEYTISELLKGIIVVSANDACVQLAETLCGSEQKFVDEMNKKAVTLGMKNTKFVNCTGLPAENQYSTAYDVSIMFRELLKYPEYHEYSNIWIEDYVHPDGRVTQFVNTNKLIRFYKGCIGGKTGFTQEAGFCLATAAKRGETEIITVIIGAESSKERFSTVSKQLDFAFANYETRNVLSEYEILDKVKVIGGRNDSVSVHIEKPFYAFVKKGDKYDFEINVELLKEIKAPIKENDVLGTIIIKDIKGREEKINLLANNSVELKTYGDTTKEIIDKW